MSLIYYSLILIGIYTIYSIVASKIKDRVPKGLKRVPKVSGGLPYVGHGLEFSKDVIGCVTKWQKQYGNIFSVKIFRTNMVIICERDLLDEFFKSKEYDLSLYDTLNRLFFGSAFSNDEKFLTVIIDIVRSTIRINYDEFLPKVEEEAKKLIDDLKQYDGQNIIISDITMKFIARTSAKCFLCIDLSDHFYNLLMKFSHILNKIVILTYFFPKWLLRLVVNPFLKYYRNQMIYQLKPLIDLYRYHKQYKDSPIIRAAVDYIDPKTNKQLSDDQIGGILICLLYVSTENTALGLSATMTDLSINKDYWDKVYTESKLYLTNNDYKGLIKNGQYVEACFNESARLNTHIFPLNRYPVKNTAVLGGYYIGNVESVGVCAPILMSGDCASDRYSNHTEYNPERFIGPNKESTRNLDLVTFGAGTHLCPGKQFAKMEIKVAQALITTMFEPFQIIKLEPNNYFSPSAFAERIVKSKITLRPIDSNNSNSNNNSKNNVKTFIKVDNYYIRKIETGWLIKDYFSVQEQINLYKYIVNLSINSTQQQEILKSSNKHPYPLTYYNLVYTGTSNCTEPIEIFETAKNIWKILCNYDKLPIFEPNSLYGQLFSEDTVTKLHKDEGCDWGISISLGAKCEFQFGDEIINLESGDIFIADFSKTEHGINSISDEIPAWFDNDYEYETINTFGKSRMSIQIIDLSNKIRY